MAVLPTATAIKNATISMTAAMTLLTSALVSFMKLHGCLFYDLYCIGPDNSTLDTGMMYHLYELNLQLPIEKHAQG